MPPAAANAGPATTFLDALAAAALLGTARTGGIGQFGPPGNLAARAAAIPKADAEAALLELAAAASPWARAGQVGTAVGQLPHAPPDAAEGDATECSAAAAGLMARMLRGEHADCLTEWLTLARERGVAPRSESLPDLLELARAHPDIRDDVIAVIGPRGRWLAAMNDAWSFAAETSADPDELWQTGTRDQRILVLRRLRRTEPARAIALLQSTWTADPAEDRAKFLPELAVGLSMADEPFLESCLDDRRKPVRAAAADLLTWLPESRLVARMTERALPMLALEPGRKGGVLKRGSKPRITVTLPKAFDPSMARDGIDENASIGRGVRSWWAHEILSRVPARTWSARWGLDPADLAGAHVEDNHADLLNFGWAWGATRSDDAEWMVALVQAAPQSEFHRWHGGGAFAAMRPEARQRTAELLLQRKQASLQVRLSALTGTEGPWPDSLSRVAIPLLNEGADARSKLKSYSFGSALEHAAECISLSSAAELAELITRTHAEKPLSHDPDRALARLEFRAAIHREFTP